MTILEEFEYLHPDNLKVISTKAIAKFDESILCIENVLNC